jgi:arginine N-succinyltransferase
MFIVRQAQPHDLDDLHALAKQTYFINLPPDREIIASKIEQSTRSFATLVPGRTKAASGGAVRGRGSSEGSGLRAVTGKSDLFMVVLEDLEGRGVIGTSQVIAKMGGPGHPRVYLQLATMTRESASLKLSWTHQTARLEKDETGPTEIGGLILNHAFRGHKQRLGRMLSYVRFHIIGVYRERFADRVVAEMLGPIDRNGYNPFFEKFTRHYIPRSFAEVFRFSQTSKEFVTGLMPPGDIDLSIMDPEVANSAGEVGEETRPARRILESLGFRYLQRIDPMDGGPHLEAKTDEIVPVKATRRVERVVADEPGAGAVENLVSTLDANGVFVAAQAPASVDGGAVRVGAEVAEAVRAGESVICGVTPLEA